MLSCSTLLLFAESPSSYWRCVTVTNVTGRVTVTHPVLLDPRGSDATGQNLSGASSSDPGRTFVWVDTFYDGKDRGLSNLLGNGWGTCWYPLCRPIQLPSQGHVLKTCTEAIDASSNCYSRLSLMLTHRLFQLIYNSSNQSEFLIMPTNPLYQLTELISNGRFKLAKF